MPSFVPAVSLGDIPSDAGIAVEVGGRTVAVFQVGDGNYYALDDACTHVGCPLSAGQVDPTSRQVICSCHEGRFDLASGEVKDGPPSAPVLVYRTRTAGGELEIELP